MRTSKAATGVPTRAVNAMIRVALLAVAAVAVVVVEAVAAPIVKAPDAVDRAEAGTAIRKATPKPPAAAGKIRIMKAAAGMAIPKAMRKPEVTAMTMTADVHGLRDVTRRMMTTAALNADVVAIANVTKTVALPAKAESSTRA